MPSDKSQAMKESTTQHAGVALSIAAFTFFVLADTCIKAVGASRMPPWQVIGCVGVVEVTLLLAYGLSRGRMRALWPKHPGRQVLRSCLDLVNNLGVVIALRHLPLALFYILVFLAPAVTTVAEALVLHERLEWKRGLAVVLGFTGVVIAVDPLGARSGDRVGFLACMVCVACFATNLVWSRRLTQTESTESLSFFSGVVMTVAGALGMVLLHADAISLRSAGFLGATGVFSVAGGFCFFVALKRASAATVSHYHYTQLLTGALVAYAIWRERPTLFMYAGAVLIVASGWLAASIARRTSEALPAG